MKAGYCPSSAIALVPYPYHQTLFIGLCTCFEISGHKMVVREGRKPKWPPTPKVPPDVSCGPGVIVTQPI